MDQTDFGRRARSKVASMKTQYWDGIRDVDSDESAPFRVTRASTDDTRAQQTRKLDRSVYYNHKRHPTQPSETKTQVRKFGPSEILKSGTFLVSGLVLGGAAYVADYFAKSAHTFGQSRFAEYKYLQTETHCTDILTSLEPYLVLSPRKSASLYRAMDQLILVWRRASAYEQDLEEWTVHFNRFDKAKQDTLNQTLQRLHNEHKQKKAAYLNAKQRAGDPDDPDQHHIVTDPDQSRQHRVQIERTIAEYDETIAAYQRQRPPPVSAERWRDVANLAFLTLKETIHSIAHIVMAFNAFWAACGRTLTMDSTIGMTAEGFLMQKNMAEHVIRTGELPINGGDPELGYSDSAAPRALRAAGKAPIDPRLTSNNVEAGAVQLYLRNAAEYDTKVARFADVFRQHFQWWMYTLTRSLPTMRQAAYALGLEVDRAMSTGSMDHSGHDAPLAIPDGVGAKARWLASQLLGDTGNSLIGSLLGGTEGGISSHQVSDQYSPVHMGSTMREKLTHAYERIRSEGVLSWFSDPFAKYQHEDATLPMGTLNIAIMNELVLGLLETAQSLQFSTLCIIADSEKRFSKPGADAANFPTELARTMYKLCDRVEYEDEPQSTAEPVKGEQRS